MSNFTLEKLLVAELATPESIVGSYARQSATADFLSLVGKFIGEDPEVIKSLEFERDLLKYKAGNFIGRDIGLDNLFHLEYSNTFSQLNTPDN